MSDTGEGVKDAQEGAEGLLERIATVLRQHQPRQVADNESRPGFRLWRHGCTGCDWLDKCDWLGEVAGLAYEAHLASAVADALGLTEETRNQYVGVGPWADPVDPKNYEDQRRFATAWELA